MNKLYCGLLATLTLLLASSAAFAAKPRPIASRAEATHAFDKMRTRLQAANSPQSSRKISKAANVEPETLVADASTWGWLYTPDDKEWLYTGVYEMAPKQSDDNYVGAGEYSIKSATFTIYDENLENRGSFKVTLPEPDPSEDPGRVETGINDIQIAPQLSRKFFHVNDAYEVMVFVHATTVDYNGHYYTLVYSLGTTASGPFQVCKIEGNQIGAVNNPKDAYDETYTMVFMREEYGEDYSYLLHFDVYHEACYYDSQYPSVKFSSNAPTLLHTFTVDYALISGSGEAALPILLNSYGGNEAGYGKKTAFVLPNYEKPFWIPYEEGLEQGIYSSYMDYIENPVLSPDNKFLIRLYDDVTFEPVKTTSIPMVEKEGYMWSFPGMGLLSGNDDVSWGLFGDGSDPHYIVGYENYQTSSDDFICDFKVYDADANCVNTIYEDAMDYIGMTDIAGQERQFCFVKFLGDSFNFDMVSIPSCKLDASIPNMIDGTSITTDIDRTPMGNSYKYASSMSTAEVDAEGNLLHGIAWFNPDGSLDHVERINLGKDVAVAMPWISGTVLNPYLFNTDDKMEYLFLVKRYNDSSSSASTEYLRLYNSDGEILLEVGPKDGNYLSSIFVLNPTLIGAKLVVAYSNGEEHTLTDYDLPLSIYSGGDGTVDNPWLIANEGDFRAVALHPEGNFAMVNNIDFKGADFAGLDCDFTGTFDGRGHIISNVNLTGDGLFKQISNTGTVKNLILFAAYAKGRAFIAGNMIGYDTSEDAKVVNVSVYNSKAESSKGFGGIVWQASTFTLIQGCSVASTDITVNSEDMETPAGALVGRLGPSAKVVASYSKSTINAPVAGGIVGEAYHNDGSILNCHSASVVNGKWIAGGIIAKSIRNNVDNCLSDGSVLATGAHIDLYKQDFYEANAGGIVGWLDTYYKDEYEDVNIVKECVSNGNVKAQNATTCIARRIVGSVSSDRLEPSGEETTETGGYVLEYGPKETRIGTNYSTASPDSTDPLEGKLITDLSTLTWSFGETYDAPWVLDGSNLHLFFENANASLVALPTEATVYAEESAVEITFTLIGSDADIKDIVIESEDTDIVEISSPIFTGQIAMVRASYVSDGTTNIRATLGALEAVAKVTARSKETPITGITVDKPNVNVYGTDPEPVEVTFTVKGGNSIQNIQITSDNEDVVTVSAPVIDDHNATVTLTFGTFGRANVVAKLLEYTALCVVNYDLSGIDTIDGDKATVILYDGQNVIAEGNVKVVNTMGAVVAQGKDKVAVGHLAKGVYIASVGGKSLKFVVK